MFRTILLTIITLIASGCTTDQTSTESAQATNNSNSPATAEETVSAKVDELISLIESAKYKEVFDSLPPEAIQKMKDSGQYETALEMFPKSNAPELLLSLIHI